MAIKSKIELVVGADGVAIITINNPPLNLLSTQVMLSLKRSIEEALLRDEVKAIVINGSKGKFSGGFDVTAFGGTQMVKKRRELGFMSIEFITDILEAARKPLVAAIDGPAFGGGLEIALACHARISTPNSQLGLTELQYGIIPGFGGTQRLPRLVGLHKGLEMILMSKRVNGTDAFGMSLVDGLASADELIGTATCWALDILEGRKPWIASLCRTDRLEPLKEARLILNNARALVRKQNPNLTHPLICIDVIEEGIVHGTRRGLWKEAETLNELRQSETCKSLVHIFFAQYNTSKIPGITDRGLLPRKLNKVAVIGGGLVGSGIATVFILSNFQVILKEDCNYLLQDGIAGITANLQSLVRTGKVTEEKLEKALSCLKGVLDYDSFKDMDLVVEAVQEDVVLKQQIFDDLEHYCPEHCIFASNTSTLDLNVIGERTGSQSQIIGAHFCSPPSIMPLLEIVRTEKTSPQVIVDLLGVAKRIKKTPILVHNSTGLVVNRISVSYYQAAMILMEQGERKDIIEQAMKNFGMSISPFRMMDGIQIGSSMSRGSYKIMPIPALPENKQDGNSTLEGFNMCEEKSRSWVNGSKVAKLFEEDVKEMILFAVVNEACRILAEGIVVKASDIDVASVLAMGFPSYRGGIIHWANTLGSKYICSRLEIWSKECGEFFKPCAYLMEQSSLGTPMMQIKSPL